MKLRKQHLKDFIKLMSENTSITSYVTRVYESRKRCGDTLIAKKETR